ncbi:hypothetical protein H9659_13885 [Sporosarcina sp. Sa3CUA8]|uniref:Uncharacterized protein n=1 Tax=Sporosarcina gallistercoris TaxID=2762245 RepID=A0ABR8PMK7_9BACL|nr:hypothetical protein [Sporosarcina gallistercoris]
MRSTSTYILNELNLIEPEKADIVKVTHLFEESTVTETNKLLDFDDKDQVILKQYEAKLDYQTNTAEVVQVLMQNDVNVIVQEYVNGELNIE